MKTLLAIYNLKVIKMLVQKKTLGAYPAGFDLIFLDAVGQWRALFEVPYPVNDKEGNINTNKTSSYGNTWQEAVNKLVVKINKS